MPAKEKQIPAVRRASRSDGEATRLHLLDTAGRVLAERGYADATSKEICLRAGTPLASVNYHFGSREGLYEAVLIEAHRQLVSLDDLTAWAATQDDPRLKLGAVLSHLVALSTRTDASWGVRVMLREIMAPSQVLPKLVEKAVRPKAAVMLGLIAAVLGLPAGHPAVQRCLLLSVLPAILLIAMPKVVLSKVLPAVGADSPALADDWLRYVLAGLDAVGAAYRD
ncbi:AcrR family transcriptional regulator [Actimicrobium sp. GrIS 1.19]|uniref:TetR/AcrR family transcriptional regulator n=1 Tax=Actimicrobium sp. GrIS 1.19 TaxID=3071708 RepID=UPI002DFF4C7A|nr:AcrR family transcriptional regulator [Actimicrobium sp. GrIS 1.19]